MMNLGLQFLHIYHLFLASSHRRKAITPQHPGEARVTRLLYLLRCLLGVATASCRLVEAPLLAIGTLARDGRLTSCHLDHLGVELTHEGVAKAADLRPVGEDFTILVSCNDLILGCLLVMAVVSRLVSSKAY